MKKMIAAIVLIAATVVHAAERPVTGEDARALFARLTKLEGKWKAHSTKGWTELNTYEVAAKGSVVFNRSFFEGEENDGMLTTFFMDGDRLMLTHYCEARNQPTLVAATIDDSGLRVAFKFDHGTNMKSRDTGHMDSLVMQFIDDDHVKSRWSWYAKGEEKWFEDIEQVRVR
jgi:hypothetical protein